MKLRVGIYLLLFSLISLFFLTIVSSKEIQEVMVFVSGISFFYSVNLFIEATRENVVSREGISDTTSSKPNVFVYQGGFYIEGDLAQSTNTINKSFHDQHITVPKNYFRVLRAIEVLPESFEGDKPSGKEVLVKLQAYIETDLDLSIEEKYEILEQIRELADAIASSEKDKQESVAKRLTELTKSVSSHSLLSNNVAQLVSLLRSRIIA